MSLTKREQGLIAGLMEAVTPRLKELERKLAAVEQMELPNLADAFKGGWRADEHYQRGDVVQRSNVTYVCIKATDQRPSESDHWRAIGKL